MRETILEPNQVTVQDIIPLVADALKSCQSVLALSRSPLASTRIVQPALVRDDVSPTAAERSHALFLALCWATDKLAPEPAAFRWGEYRPFDDPTWRDPRWWRYNILRHRYLDPLHPDDFVAGGRFTETLLNLTGIPSADSFFDERSRALREVSQWLLRQWRQGEADAELARRALRDLLRPLQRNAAALRMLEIGATFEEVFPRRLLLDLAEAEGEMTATALESLIQERYVLAETPMQDQNEARFQQLWMSPPLRQYVYQRVPTATRRTRHARAARAFERQRRPLAAGKQYRLAEQPAEAARVLLQASERLVEEMEVEALRQELQALEIERLPADAAYRVLAQAADLHRMAGDHDAAVAACRRALRAAGDVRQQGQIYRRLAKLYERRNQSHAVNYYRQAIACFNDDDPELIELLRDRSWLHILRRAWADAEADLTRALGLNSARSEAQGSLMEADIHDALSSLRRRQGNYQEALAYGLRALAVREAEGDALRVASSLGNLGLVYNDQRDYAHAIAAHQEAAVTYRQLGNQEYELTAMLNVGLAQHLGGQLDAAIRTYSACLELGMEIGHHLTVVTAHSNLAEAYATLGQTELARTHWRAGYDLSRRYGFDDELRYYAELAVQFDALRGLADEPTQPAVTMTHVAASVAFVPNDLDEAERIAWRLAQESGRVTARTLMEEAAVSKPTATRKLAALVERGLLEKHGQGRGTHYALADSQLRSPEQSAEIARISQRLQAIRTELREEYGLIGLAVVTGAATLPGLLPGALNIIVRFVELPDLVTFFGLEARIGRQCEQPLKLLPAATLPDDGVTDEPADLVWLWA